MGMPFPAGSSSATGDELHIEEGALYPALRRLEEKGLLDAGLEDHCNRARGKGVHPHRRRSLRQLKAEVTAWSRYVSAMTRALEARPNGGHRMKRREPSDPLPLSNQKPVDEDVRT